MIVTRKRWNALEPPCMVLGTSSVERTHSFKYLGIIISSNLEDIHPICSRAKRVISVLYHHFYLNADTEILLQLYSSMVTLLLEYACHPHLSEDIEKLEHVQKLALRLCTKQWSLDYDMLLSTCNLLTLAAQRKFFCLCQCLK